MTRFTRDNTDGYSASDLAELNRRFKAAIAKYHDEDQEDKSVRDMIAERVLSDFDTEHS